MSAKAAPTTLWSPSATPDARALAFTIGDDPHWDSQLLRWDVIGSLGHIAGLRSANILSPVDHQRLHNHLLSALSAVESGELSSRANMKTATPPSSFGCRSAIRSWERVCTPDGRAMTKLPSICGCFMKSSLQKIVELAGQLATVLLDFAAQHRQTLWPGFTHQRRAMPSSLGLWSAALAEGLIDTIETHAALLGQIDRSPLGSAAGYGVPLSLDREATAQALGFAGLVQVVTAVQNGRGKARSSAAFSAPNWVTTCRDCVADVCLYSAEEFGFLILPADLATGSSLMPHKRNPMCSELGRAKMAALDGI